MLLIVLAGIAMQGVKGHIGKTTRSFAMQDQLDRSTTDQAAARRNLE